MRLITIISAILIALGSSSQIVPQTKYLTKDSDPLWTQLMYGDSPNLLEVKEAYEEYYRTHSFEKNRHTQYYKRWVRNSMPYADADGNINFDRDLRAEREYLEAYQNSQNMRDGGDWQELGPWHFDPEVALYFQVQSPGACHIYTVEQAPSNPDVIYAGAATAGLWKSTDKGLSWELVTRDMLVTSVYSIAIDENDENVVYFGEGNGTIWKSVNGGLSWAQTGDSEFQNEVFWCRDLKTKPGEPTTLFAATNSGLYHSSDAGSTWFQLETGEFMEIEFHPTDPETVYCVSLLGNQTRLFKSTNGGLSFEIVGDGWPSPGAGEEQKRCEIAVTAAEPDKLFVLASGSANGGSGLYGIYVSEDAGETFEFQCCGDQPAGPPLAGENPNILGWSEQGDGDGGQYYYDLGLGASPTDPDKIFSAGINVWRSEDSGQNWSLNAHWVTWVGEFTHDRYTHADVHDVKFFETEDGVDMWVASDGGLFYSSDQGDNIEPRMYGIHGTDFWGWQAGFKHGEVMVGGTYHNGTLIRNEDLYYWGMDDAESGGWLAELAGDNFRGFVNPGDHTIGYHDGGAFRYSNDRFTRITGLPFDNSKRPNTSYWYGEYGNLEWDPTCYNRLYTPFETTLYRSENGGSSWTALNDFGGTKIVSVKVAPRDPERIYVSHNDGGSGWKIWKSEDGGDNWENITPSNSITGNNNNRPKYLEVDGTNPDLLWCVIVGNHTGYKVFESEDGGATWSDITTDEIASEYSVSLAHQRGTNKGLYLGTDRAVYYKSGDMSAWELYNSGLPAKNSAVFLQSYYCDGKIRAAGPRGVHHGDFYETSDVIAGMTASKLIVNIGVQCEADTVRFTDNSVITCDGATYDWVFEGADPPENSGEQVFAIYDTPGSYDVSLTVVNADGIMDSYTIEDMITVVDEPVGFPITEDFNDDFPPEFWKIHDPEGGGHWEHGTVLGDEENRVAQFPNYWVNTTDQTDLLIMPAQNFSDVEDPILHFDVSYHTYADYVDGLEVWYKIDDDPDWTPIYSKLGDELHVDGNYVWFWYDLGGELVWRTDTVDLSPLEGESCVTLAFANIGGYGNHIWVDNVNLTTEDAVNIDEIGGENSVFLFPNPTNDKVTIRFKESDWANYQLYDSRGRLLVSDRVMQNGIVDLSRYETGIYWMRFDLEERVQTARIVKR